LPPGRNSPAEPVAEDAVEAGPPEGGIARARRWGLKPRRVSPRRYGPSRSQRGGGAAFQSKVPRASRSPTADAQLSLGFSLADAGRRAHQETRSWARPPRAWTHVRKRQSGCPTILVASGSPSGLRYQPSCCSSGGPTPKLSPGWELRHVGNKHNNINASCGFGPDRHVDRVERKSGPR